MINDEAILRLTKPRVTGDLKSFAFAASAKNSTFYNDSDFKEAFDYIEMR